MNSPLHEQNALAAKQQARKDHSALTSDLTKALEKSRRAAFSWLGAVQYVVYDMPQADPRRQAYSGEGDVKSHIRASADAWFEAMDREVRGAFSSAQQALSNDWQMSRDERHDNAQSFSERTKRLEENVTRIIESVANVNGPICEGCIRPMRGERKAFDKLRATLNDLIAVFDKHLPFESSLEKARETLANQPRGERGEGWRDR